MSSLDEKLERAKKVLADAKKKDQKAGKVVVKLSDKLSVMVTPPYDIAVLKAKYKCT